LVSEVAPLGLRESWKGGISIRGRTSQSSVADDRDGLRLQDQCFGWGTRERSAPPPSMKAATMVASTSPSPAPTPTPTPTAGLLRRRLPLLN
jgi:hypothetical protein